MVVILLPPAPPISNRGNSLTGSTTMVGAMDDRGLFPGSIKFAGDGRMPHSLTLFGDEKSSMSSLNKIPVLWPYMPEPKLEKISKKRSPIFRGRYVVKNFVRWS